MTKAQQQLVTTVWHHYQTAGRHTLPWRQTTDPYRILVSEIMLQQTQVDRVIPKYLAFMDRFPDVAALAASTLGEVLSLWQGLGYNRRAQALHACAKHIMLDHAGRVPQTEAALCALPGIGPYTARAILAFAFAMPVSLIETNVRTVYLHHFFPRATDVPDAALWPHITATVDQKRPREWYCALMDYGSFLKKAHGNNISRSRTYTVQRTFKGSDREIRGAIVRCLCTQSTGLTRRAVSSALDTLATPRVYEQLDRLVAEGLVTKVGQRYQLPT